ncbi:Hypothetical predicted protein [Marmota monax]|uniref:Uncharacterized protein n=1 Tax=Marmota monax TaxID=9995 RepID=A0A5E4B004_MARMO|nr:Hypothetical predicted protein [Marmota monax]
MIELWVLPSRRGGLVPEFRSDPDKPQDIFAILSFHDVMIIQARKNKILSFSPGSLYVTNAACCNFS